MKKKGGRLSRVSGGRIKETIGLIGVGNMGTAIIEGLLVKRLARPSQIFLFDKLPEKVRTFRAKYKCCRASNARDLVRRSQLIILAIKPQDLPELGRELAGVFQASQVLVSILAGTPIRKIRKVVGPGPKIIRAMPNLGARVGEAITALTTADASGQAMLTAIKIFSGCGKTVVLAERYFDLVTALSGSGPAYFFLLMELLEREGIRKGLSTADARLLAVQTSLGAARLAAVLSQGPATLRQMVTSKGGTTEAALKVLEKKKFSDIFHTALEAALKRGRILSQSA